mmetsp:Transcript_14523/g.31602  ORF Transcript_14523/g.31602 Transcript_14523/m.31602 type:complete len:85 (+) Transcript_14523:714-968(+)
MYYLARGSALRMVFRSGCSYGLCVQHSELQSLGEQQQDKLTIIEPWGLWRLRAGATRSALGSSSRGLVGGGLDMLEITAPQPHY